MAVVQVLNHLNTITSGMAMRNIITNICYQIILYYSRMQPEYKRLTGHLF
jgi:hypothetical protein